ncbi:hypothetical protein BKA70DRAFT_1558648 [Coprinopsis sp. MPI-PUGE-AT-0042]|nr:hypothetical protein BKA70DRAFT_1558648 [Coprinopsis sp. MPI-PUGE-AT-0042]
MAGYIVITLDKDKDKGDDIVDEGRRSRTTSEKIHAGATSSPISRTITPSDRSSGEPNPSRPIPGKPYARSLQMDQPSVTVKEYIDATSGPISPTSSISDSSTKALPARSISGDPDTSSLRKDQKITDFLSRRGAADESQAPDEDSLPSLHDTEGVEFQTPGSSVNSPSEATATIPREVYRKSSTANAENEDPHPILAGDDGLPPSETDQKYLDFFYGGKRPDHSITGRHRYDIVDEPDGDSEAFVESPDPQSLRVDASGGVNTDSNAITMFQGVTHVSVSSGGVLNAAGRDINQHYQTVYEQLHQNAVYQYQHYPLPPLEDLQDRRKKQRKYALCCIVM